MFSAKVRGKRSEKARESRPAVRGEGRGFDPTRRRVLTEAKLGSVYAARFQCERREEAVEFGDGPAADERESSAQSRFDTMQIVDQASRHDDGIRRRRDVDERAIDIEEEAGILRGEFGFHHGLLAMQDAAKPMPNCRTVPAANVW